MFTELHKLLVLIFTQEESTNIMICIQLAVSFSITLNGILQIYFPILISLAQFHCTPFGQLSQEKVGTISYMLFMNTLFHIYLDLKFIHLIILELGLEFKWKEICNLDGDII